MQFQSNRGFILLLLIVLPGGLFAQSALQPFTENYKIGYKDADGRIVVHAQYTAGSEMKEGFAVILKDRKRGYLNAQGREAIPCRYEDASNFSSGLACVQLGGRFGFIDAKGDWVIQPEYDLAFSFREGLARVCRAGRWGMIDRQGRVVIPILYSRLYDLSEGLIAASADGLRYGYINAEGKTVISFKYRHAQPFDARQRAIVAMDGGNFFINRRGRVLERIVGHEDEEEEEREREREEKRAGR